MVPSHFNARWVHKLRKMNILPKFIYLFQSVPILIPKSFFTQLGSVISSYIWQGKRPRIRRALLQRPKKDGGMGLPDFRHYYWASNIRCNAFWTRFYHHPDNPDWTSMELNSCRDISLPALLGAPLSCTLPKSL